MAHIFSKSILVFALSLVARVSWAQLPAIISAPIEEDISRQQIVHQSITDILMTEANRWPARWPT